MKGYIYKLIVDGTTTIYVGSTVDIKKRRRVHKYNCFKENGKSYDMNVYKTIRDYGITINDYYNRVNFECIEEIDFNERYELGAREKFHILELKPCGNILVPYDKCKEEADKEQQRQYREKNKDKIKEYQREHYQKNKEKFTEKRKEYREKNKEKIKEYREKNKEKRKEYREKNEEKIKEQKRQYRLKNRDEINRKRREKRRLKKL